MNALYNGYPHWRSVYGLGLHFKCLLVGLFFGGVAVGLGFADVYSHTIGFVLGVALVLLVQYLGFLVRKTTKYTVTSQTIRLDWGVIRRGRREFSVRKVQEIEVKQNIIERFILKTGNLSIDSAAPGMSGTLDEVVFKGVRRPHEVADTIRNADTEPYGSAGDAYAQLRQYDQQQHVGYAPQEGGYNGRPPSYDAPGYGSPLGDRPPSNLPPR
jgi:membrane protein YdbS with pleckstrin-like domain